ncbi:MAG: S8 family serine peptidase, partial [Acidimicrobiia bacterium]
MRSRVVILVLAFSPLSAALAAEPNQTDPSVEVLVAASPEVAEARGLTVVEDVGFGWILVEGPVEMGTSSDEVAARIAAASGLETEPNYVYELADEPLFAGQWALENTGQDGGTSDADVDAAVAWEITTGSPGVVIAVLDTGVASEHPDLASRMWVNSDEVGGNGLDDDGNGWVDDTGGWDAVDGDPDPGDADGHGTFVASTAVAAANGVGMSGMAPASAVMPVRVCADAGCSLSDIITGLAYAVANGADVVNLSLGGPGKFPASLETALRMTIDSGIVVVASAGNDTVDNDVTPYYPASYDLDGLIAVAATDRNDQLSWFSNYGAVNVDLAAPGEDVIGALPPNGWGTSSGTSFSAPLVSGVAALIKATRPNLDPPGVATMINGSVDELPGLAGKVVTGGRLNAGAALRIATAPIAVGKATPSDAVLPVTIDLNGSGSSDPWGSLVSRSWKLPGGGVASAVDTQWTPKRPGTYEATLTVVDDDGLIDTATVVFTVRLRPGGSFVDDNGHFGERAIEAIKAESITLGCNPPANDRFCPADPVTRGEMAAFLARALRLAASIDDHFADDDDSVFEGAINRLAQARITVGCNPPANTRFCPEDPVTRGQTAAFLVRAFHLGTGSGLDVFVDDDGVFENAIDRLAAAGITT